MKTTTEVNTFQPSFWELKAENTMVKRVGETILIIVQVKGQDLSQDFCHQHRRVTYPSKERLEEALKKFVPSTEEKYDSQLAAFFQVNDPKREIFNRIRQERYDRSRTTP